MKIYLLDRLLDFFEKYNFDVNDILKILLRYDIATFALNDCDYLKIRYEYIYNNKIKNVFIYFEKFIQFIRLYNLIPENKRHLYEIINDKCKFFLDLDEKYNNITYDEWKENIIYIKKELKNHFQKKFNKNITIIEYESYPTTNEKKYSCHIIISNLSFYARDCKFICDDFLNSLEKRYTNIIDNSVYGKRRMLRIEGCTKINSNRKKICKYNNFIGPKYIINIEGLITNLYDTEFVYNNINYINNNKKDNDKIINIFNFNPKFNKNEKINYTREDIMFIDKNYRILENIVNKWCNSRSNNKPFSFSKIKNNIIEFKSLIPYFCPKCKKNHDSQNPYIFLINKRLYFNCRRTPQSIEITYLLNLYNLHILL